MKLPACVDQAVASCGEGLLWDDRRKLLWWVDIAKERLHSFVPETGKTHAMQLPYLISALAHHQDGGLLIATLKGLGTIDPESGAIDIVHSPEPHIPGNRLNDMAPDPDGRLWVGTMSEGAKSASGSLYQYGPDGVTKQLDGTTISNGMDWSPDGSRHYFIDSTPRLIHVHEAGEWRSFYQFKEGTGRPDGMCVDQNGTLWVALCDKGKVLGLSPEGEIIDTIHLPCEIVTNCAFGGSDLRTLFITTGTFSLSEAEKAANPQAGGLFAMEMDVPGRVPFKARWPS